MTRRIGMLILLVAGVTVMTAGLCSGSPEFCDRFPEASSCQSPE
jgi:hypothetical protein